MPPSCPEIADLALRLVHVESALRTPAGSIQSELGSWLIGGCNNPPRLHQEVLRPSCACRVDLQVEPRPCSAGLPRACRVLALSASRIRDRPALVCSGPMLPGAMPMPAQSPWWARANLGQVLPSPDQAQMGCGLVALDLECIHDHVHGSYAALGWHETADQWSWKARCQIIELAAVNLITGEPLLLRSRPEFQWQDVKSQATRLFAEHSGHKEIVCDRSLPLFAQLWTTQVLPFLQRAAGFTGKVVLIAHNGDKFDHYVLNKEIVRLGLDMSQCPHLVSADAVATLKLILYGTFHLQERVL